MRKALKQQPLFRFAVMASAGFFLSCQANSRPRLETLTVPPGFRIELFSDQVPGARSLALGSQGTIFVGTRGRGLVYALQDQNQDGRAEKPVILAAGLVMPNGVAFKDGALYVAEIHRISRYDAIEDHLLAPPEPVVVNQDFPQNPYHGWKFIAFGPDGKLYIPVGAPCNVCLEKDPRFATLMRMNADGTELEIFARGIRNTVGFDWQPGTHVLWFTDNGRDGLGDDLPPDELNAAAQPGLHFGFPFFYGRNQPDPKLAQGRDSQGFTPSAVDLEAHVAALGMRFYTGTQFPPDYQGQIFIAEHGSWNRSQKIGYRVVSVRLDGRGGGAPRVFAQGWLQGQRAWGRPVDVLVMPDGSLLVSDDKAGAVYRITYPGEPETPATPPPQTQHPDHEPVRH